jgi:hypothetical protein
MFLWLISDQPTVIFSQNKSATSQTNEQAESFKLVRIIAASLSCCSFQIKKTIMFS